MSFHEMSLALRSALEGIWMSFHEMSLALQSALEVIWNYPIPWGAVLHVAFIVYVIGLVVVCVIVIYQRIRDLFITLAGKQPLALKIWFSGRGKKE
jgi:hypothetical protein